MKHGIHEARYSRRRTENSLLAIFETDSQPFYELDVIETCQYRIPIPALKGREGVRRGCQSSQSTPQLEWYLRLMLRNLFKLSVLCGWLVLTDRSIGNNCLYFR